MTRVVRAAAAALLLLLVFVCAAAPWLGFRDPRSQPDVRVLHDLPPMSLVRAVRLDDGSLRYATDVRVLADGSLELSRGADVERVASEELAADWDHRAFYPLGTDSFGRDMLSRMVYGGRVSLLVGLCGAAMALVFGTLIGLTAGLAGGWIDGLLMRFTDLVLAVPRLFLALLLVALYRPSLGTTIAVLGVTTWMAAARVVRGEVLAMRDREFVQAARAAGVPPLRIALRHLLPAVVSPVIVEGTLRVADTILLESALSYLELGVRPPTPSWGNLIADGRHSLFDAWWIATLPGIAIAATVVAIYGLGEALRERLHTERPVVAEPAPPAVSRQRLAAVVD